MAVALATSSLDQRKSFLQSSDTVKTDYNENQIKSEEVKDIKETNTEDSDTEVVWKRRETTPKVVKPSRCNGTPGMKECHPSSLPSEMKATNNREIETVTDKQVDKCAKESTNSILTENSCHETTESKLISTDSITECDQGHGQSNVLSGESLRDFALKLRYSESEVSSALSKLGPDADKNLLLMELVKAQNSAKQIEEGSSLDRPQSTPPVVCSDPNTLRAIVLDGSNVAMSHGNQKVFSCRGIGIAVDWFIKRGHRDIKVFVPSWRKESSKPESPIIDQQVLKRLEEDQILVWTPSRCINNRRVVCYDDRFIIKLAHQTDGVIVSNDNFRDLQNESPEWRKVIEQRLLMYSFVDDRFMPPDDPAGRHGPTLDEFLKKGCGKPCPYGRRCTYGNRCKYLHPERNSKSEAEMNMLANQLSEKLLLNPPEVPYGEVHCSPRHRPLPPPPDMPAYLLTKPLPPLPTEQRQKPLPIPPAEVHHNMVRIFPPTLRNNHTSQTGQRPASDPSPMRSPSYDMQPDQYGRTRRGSIPHGMTLGPQYVDGYPSLPSSSGHYSHPMYPAHTHLPPHPPHHQETVARGMVPQHHPERIDEHMYACGYQQPFLATPQHWGVYPPQYHFSSNHHHGYQHHYPNSYNGQSNSYYRTRAPPRDVTDGAGSDDCDEETRIRIYEKLVEVFPDDATKILKVMDENPTVTDIDELTQILLDSEK
ncbi:endoribonuclease ZC3H12A isoform X2 [Exaiptasia diaphana]|nr:endoribonuclease ZC3H12A isoform X2 [Exaiptasia diaphana]